MILSNWHAKNINTTQYCQNAIITGCLREWKTEEIETEGYVHSEYK